VANQTKQTSIIYDMLTQVIIETQAVLAYGAIKAKQMPVELSTPQRAEIKDTVTVFFMVVAICNYTPGVLKHRSKTNQNGLKPYLKYNKFEHEWIHC
jgi:hypothetical protein